MHVPNYSCSIVLVLTNLLRAQAHRTCTEYISLEDLLTEAYGIELTVDGLHSAVAFHNGTMEHIGYHRGSVEYQSLMQSILSKELGGATQRRTSCRRARTYYPEPSPFDDSFLSFLIALFSLPGQLWDKYMRSPEPPEPPVPVSPTVQLFRSELKAVPPFADMSDEQRAHVSVSIAIPAWLTGTEEECQIDEAAEMAFGRIGHSDCPPSAAYTALGYELCPIDFDAFECTGPGRIMTIEFEDDLTVMTVGRTPFWIPVSIIFSAFREQDDHALVERINSFVDTVTPDMVAVIGTSADIPQQRDDVLRSRAATHLIEQPSIPVHRAVAMGAAQGLKDFLESHSDDCSESEECIEVRKQADQIAGTHNISRPSVWPAIGRLHLHDEL